MIILDDDDPMPSDADISSVCEDSSVCEEDDHALALGIDASLQATTGTTHARQKPIRSKMAVLRSSSGARSSRRTSSPVREILPSCTSFLGERIVPGDTVELQYSDRLSTNPSKLPSGDFLRVYEVLQEPSSEGTILLKGILFRRTKYMQGTFVRKTNEVCMLLDSSPATEQGELEQSMVLRPLDTVIKKRELCLTNEDFPSHSFRLRQQARGANRYNISYNYNLVCRWAYIGQDLCFSSPHWLSERVLIRLSQDICRIIRQSEDVFLTLGDLRKANQRRRASLSTGRGDQDIIKQYVDQSARLAGNPKHSSKAGSTPGDAINVDEEPELSVIRETMNSNIQPSESGSPFSNNVSSTTGQRSSESKRYTVCDAFCGGGGVSQSTRMAGLDVVLAVDQDPHCAVTYMKNHPTVDICIESIDHFIHRFHGKWPRIDILHISPPCQFFSPAKTWASNEDDANRAALFSVHHLIEAIRPRVVTIEQTFGITTSPKHKAYYHALLGMFTSNGYNVRARNIRFADYGSYQSRRRLIMIGTRAGEPLIDFPPPTHNQHGGNGLPSWLTKRDFLAKIGNLPRGPLHWPENMRLRDGLPEDLDDQFGTVTTSNSVPHPDGHRALTTLEFAILQSFPANYDWSDDQVPNSVVRKQIGNAVPPANFSHFLRHIRQNLEKLDAEMVPGEVES
ncbi:S-adenosyl-L-methionine-dependent methyltransferase [Viridothelium virens]|uniref:DNA (cytosine-5-)-methyltransferase n=1 Tax=Viridothelium virens TaxID=1048519 RepID=A0A6A6HI77_VIRVR|nr:S-adenosyl-L-methionine-dependent methyltransferase [Viridothelium virens]